MSDVCVDLKDVLETASIGTFAATSGWGIYISKEPDTPDTTITLYPYGSPVEPNPKFLIDYLNVQARIRGDVQGYAAAQTKAQAVKDALLGLTAQTVNTSKYIGVWMNTDIFLLRYDDNDRPILVINFRVIREPASGTYRGAIA